MKLKKLAKKGGTVTNILLQADLIIDKNNNFNINKPIVNNRLIDVSSIKNPDTLYKKILQLLSHDAVNNYTTNIIDFLDKINNNPNCKIIRDDSNLTKLKYKEGDFQDKSTFFDDTTEIFSNFTTIRTNENTNLNKNNTHINFQSNKFPVKIIINDNTAQTIEYRDLFAKYKIFTYEDEQHFVTIDPEIILALLELLAS